MRMINDINKLLEVDEVVSVEATYGWCDQCGSTEENPDVFVVTIGRLTVNGTEFMEFGEYTLDGNKETFEKAVENFNGIVTAAAINGYFRISDFKSFEVY